MSRTIPEIDFRLATSHRVEDRATFVKDVGDALKDIGFFALKNHGIPRTLIESAYAQCDAFFDLPTEQKLTYKQPAIGHQRGYTSFGTEHAKDQSAPDLKEFWQTGRTHQPGDAPPSYPENCWPTHHVPGFEATIDDLYRQLETLSQHLLNACSTYLGMPEHWLSEMTEGGNTIMRLIHYPPIDETMPHDGVRSAAHEDINFITLLVTATAEGLQVKDHDGTWISVTGDQDSIIVDSGDMIQNLTNGLFKSTTHRVVNPEDISQRRYSMPMFVHPRNEIDLTPHPKFISMTGGEANYPRISAGEYLHQRLVEIGLI